MELKWHEKILYNFMVISPVLAILGLISIVYFGYMLTYISVLINFDTYRHTTYPFFHTSTIETAYSKGFWLG